MFLHSEMMAIAPQYSQHGIPGGHMYLHGGMTPQQKYLRPIQHHQQVVTVSIFQLCPFHAARGK